MPNSDLPPLHVGDRTLATDGEGFLLDRRDWNAEVAAALADREHIELTPAHWEVIHLLQEYYDRFEHVPAMRALAKYVGQQLGPDQGRSLYLLKLFPGSPAKLAARIAGLPRPDHCL